MDERLISVHETNYPWSVLRPSYSWNKRTPIRSLHMGQNERTRYVKVFSMHIFINNDNVDFRRSTMDCFVPYESCKYEDDIWREKLCINRETGVKVSKNFLRKMAGSSLIHILLFWNKPFAIHHILRTDSIIQCIHFPCKALPSRNQSKMR